MASMVLGDSTLESLTPSVNAPLEGPFCSQKKSLFGGPFLCARMFCLRNKPVRACSTQECDKHGRVSRHSGMQ
jgi:hypothetical protein